MTPDSPGYRLLAATGIDRGDRLYQQDQVEVFTHPRAEGCLLAVLADGMGGKSGGRKAADQVVHTAQQLFDRYVPTKDDPAEILRQLVLESHLMIKLTAITAEEEPHSTLAAFLVGPGLAGTVVHAGDSRVYHFRGADMVSRTLDNSYVQRLIDEGKITEDEALEHPHKNLVLKVLNGSTQHEPDLGWLDIQAGDRLMICSDGLCGLVTDAAMAPVLAAGNSRPQTIDALVEMAHAAGGYDNITIVLADVEVDGPIGTPEAFGAADNLGTGDICDDILDIWADLQRGLLAYDAGDPIDAAWYWRLMYTHWSNHAVNALQALRAASER